MGNGKRNDHLIFLEGHMLASKRVAQKGNGSRGDAAISSSIACHVEKFDLIF